MANKEKLFGLPDQIDDNPLTLPPDADVFADGKPGNYVIVDASASDDRAKGVISHLLYSLLLGALLTSASMPASSHVRWFVNDGGVPANVTFLFDPVSGLVLLGAFLFSGLVWAVHVAAKKHVHLWRLVHEEIRVPFHLDWRLVAVVFGGTLIINSMMKVFVAPNIPVETFMLHDALYFLQIIVGTMFLLQVHLIPASVIVVLIPFVCLAFCPPNVMVDYWFELIGLGVAFYLIAPSLSIVGRLQHKILANAEGAVQVLLRSLVNQPLFDLITRRQGAFAVVRIMLGLQLATLAIHNKLLNPSIALIFVEENSFVNFMPLLGVERFTNLHFVLAAGVAELTLGLLLIANIAPRIVCAFLAVIFLTTAGIFGIEELAGHAPIVAILMLIIIHGTLGIAEPSKKESIWLRKPKTLSPYLAMDNRHQLHPHSISSTTADNLMNQLRHMSTGPAPALSASKSRAH